MTIVRIAAAAAIVAMTSSTAFAGGFNYFSLGGNLGNFAYGDGAAGSDVIVDSGKSCSRRCGKGKGGPAYGEAVTESYGQSDTYLEKYNAGSVSTAGTKAAGAGDQVHIQAASQAVAGSGLGAGIGFKAGGFDISKNGGKKRW